ncbi:hypothetical protein HPB47_021249, partial [Ixodes persulcatus]
GNAPTVTAQLQAFGLKLDVLLGLKSSVDTLLTLPAKVDELLSLKPTVERLEAHIQELESKLILHYLTFKLPIFLPYIAFPSNRD